MVKVLIFGGTNGLKTRVLLLMCALNRKLFPIGMLACSYDKVCILKW